MTAPRFSLVIATRDRPHTLRFALANCLAQDGDFEVVVSDNGTGPRAREVVGGCGDRRARYVRTPEPLAMTDSLEFALGHARGEYVLLRGDDDGLMRHALPTLDRALADTGAAALRWESAVYNWPDVSNPHFRAGALLVPLPPAGGYALEALDGRRAVADVAAGRAHYSELPGVYTNAVVRRDLLDRVRARAGRVFKTRTPDVYAAFAVAAAADTFHALRAPVGLCGRSGASTGVARHFSKKGSPIDREFRRQNDAAGLRLHPRAPDLPPIPAAVADAFLWAKADLFPDDPGLALDRARLVRDCLREVEADTADEWQEARDACRLALADSPELLAWFEREYGGVTHTDRAKPDRGYDWRRVGPGHLYLDAGAFGVRDVDAAADLCERLLGYKAEGLELRPGPAADAAAELREKEAAVQHLSGACAALQTQLRDTEEAYSAALGAARNRLEQADRERAALLARAERAERQSAEQQARIEELARRRGLAGLLRRAAGRLRRAG